MIDRSKQFGASWAITLIFVSLLGIFAISILRLAPTYMQFMTLKSEMKAVRDEAVLKKYSVGQIQDRLQKRMDMSSIAITNLKDFKIETKPALHIEAKFEVRKKLGLNIDAVMMFNPVYGPE